MKHYAIFNSETGVVVQTGRTPGDIADQLVPQGHSIIEVEGEVDWRVSRVVDGQIVTIPQRPSPKHVWSGGGWVDTTPLSERIDMKSRQIDAERERRSQLPIEYEGNLFDADATAQRNVQAWMTNVASGNAPPGGFVWRDFNNVDRPANPDFIRGLGNAIIARGTQLYQTAWAKKGALRALTTESDVDAFDPLSGW